MQAEALINTAETALDSVDVLTTLTGNSKSKTSGIGNAVNTGQYGLQFADCTLDAARDASGAPAYGAAPNPYAPAPQQADSDKAALAYSGFSKALMCPEELGTQGNEAIANTLADLGVDAAPFFKPTVAVSKDGPFDKLGHAVDNLGDSVSNPFSSSKKDDD
jgi:hypothetical protein